jgi:hypothetical protein
MGTDWRGAFPPPDPAALSRALQAARAEQARPRSTYRRDAAVLGTALLGLTGAAMAGTRLAGLWRLEDLVRRLPTLALLVSVQGVAAWAAVAPRARRAQVATGLLGLLAMAAVVGLRGAGAPSPLPPWVCTLSHLGVGVVPAAVTLWLLRRAAFDVPRALAGGMGAGAAGALLGELACGQGAWHVLAFHLPAWLAVVSVVMVLGRRQKPRSFAP